MLAGPRRRAGSRSSSARTSSSRGPARARPRGRGRGCPGSRSDRLARRPRCSSRTPETLKSVVSRASPLAASSGRQLLGRARDVARPLDALADLALLRAASSARDDLAPHLEQPLPVRAERVVRATRRAPRGSARGARSPACRAPGMWRHDLVGGEGQDRRHQPRQRGAAPRSRPSARRAAAGRRAPRRRAGP